ncbi:hypothetical protein [Nitrosomonas sp. Nm84]|uniref:hypothetical protein n=1 Tax=Nitrosomonas sp. Nm84 TaxID=200124 RepID=UPI000D76A93D|nr:hypothetical protein [Nitrosomonas sp. Nm84]
MRCVIDVPVFTGLTERLLRWLHRVPSFRERDDGQFSSIVKNAFEKSRNTYGTRRLKIALSHQG